MFSGNSGRVKVVQDFELNPLKLLSIVSAANEVF